MKQIKLILGVYLIILFCLFIWAADDKAQNTVSLTAPGQEWSLLIDLPGFKKGSSFGQYAGTNKETGVNISIFLEPAAQPGDSKACREFYLKKMRSQPDAKTSEKGDMAINEYLIKEMAGIPLNNKHLNAYISRDGIWIDIHLSKVSWQEQDMQLFDAILNTVRFKGKDMLTKPEDSTPCDLKKREKAFKCAKCNKMLKGFKCEACVLTNADLSEWVKKGITILGHREQGKSCIAIDYDEDSFVIEKCPRCGNRKLTPIEYLTHHNTCWHCGKKPSQVVDYCVKFVYSCPEHAAFESFKPGYCREVITDAKGREKKCGKKLERNRIVYSPIIYVYECPKCKERVDEPGKCETCQRRRIKKRTCEASGIFPHVNEVQWKKAHRK